MAVMKKALYDGVVRRIVDLVNDFWASTRAVKSAESSRRNYPFVPF